MAEPFSEDLCKRLIAAAEDGASRRSVAERFGVVASTVTKLLQHLKRTGSLAPARQGGDRRSDHIEAHADEIKALVVASHDITLEEIVAHLKQAHGATFAVSTIWRCLDRARIDLQKNGPRQRAGARRRGGGPRPVARRAA